MTDDCCCNPPWEFLRYPAQCWIINFHSLVSGSNTLNGFATKTFSGSSTGANFVLANVGNPGTVGVDLENGSPIASGSFYKTTGRDLPPATRGFIISSLVTRNGSTGKSGVFGLGRAWSVSWGNGLIAEKCDSYGEPTSGTGLTLTNIKPTGGNNFMSLMFIYNGPDYDHWNIYYCYAGSNPFLSVPGTSNGQETNPNFSPSTIYHVEYAVELDIFQGNFRTGVFGVQGGRWQNFIVACNEDQNECCNEYVLATQEGAGYGTGTNIVDDDDLAENLCVTVLNYGGCIALDGIEFTAYYMGKEFVSANSREKRWWQGQFQVPITGTAPTITYVVKIGCIGTGFSSLSEDGENFGVVSMTRNGVAVTLLGTNPTGNTIPGSVMHFRDCLQRIVHYSVSKSTTTDCDIPSTEFLRISFIFRAESDGFFSDAHPAEFAKYRPALWGPSGSVGGYVGDRRPINGSLSPFPLGLSETETLLATVVSNCACMNGVQATLEFDPVMIGVGAMEASSSTQGTAGNNPTYIEYAGEIILCGRTFALVQSMIDWGIWELKLIGTVEDHTAYLTTTTATQVNWYPIGSKVRDILGNTKTLRAIVRGGMSPLSSVFFKPGLFGGSNYGNRNFVTSGTDRLSAGLWGYVRGAACSSNSFNDFNQNTGNASASPSTTALELDIVVTRDYG